MKKRLFHLMLVIVPLTLACNFVMQPFNQAKDTAATIEALTTIMPIETLAAIPTAMGEILPTLESGMTTMPDIPNIPGMGDYGNLLDPMGEPVKTWRDIPVMPQAVAGQEFPDVFTYSYRVLASVDEVTQFYEQTLKDLGWQSMFSMPSSGEGALLMYTNQDVTLIITISPALGKEGVVVMLQLPQ